MKIAGRKTAYAAFFDVDGKAGTARHQKAGQQIQARKVTDDEKLIRHEVVHDDADDRFGFSFRDEKI